MTKGLDCKSEKVTFLDTETASFQGGICQIGKIETNESLEWIAYDVVKLVNPQMKIGYGAQGIHFITDEQVQSAPYFQDIKDQFVPTEGYLIAHNASFDVRMIEADGGTIPEGVKVLDTLELAKRLIPKQSCENHKLGTLYHYFKCYNIMDYKGDAHDALFDCHMLRLVLKAILLEYALTLEDAYNLCNQPIQEQICDMKKYRESGKTWQEVFDEDPSYCEWLLGNYNFSYHKQGQELKEWLENTSKSS